MISKVSLVLLLALAVSGGCGQEVPGAPAPAAAAKAEQEIPRLFGFEIRDVFGIPTFLIFIMGQFFPAQTSDTFPTSLAILNLSPSFTTYRMRVCDRTRALDCIYLPKTSTNPERIQGVWWSDGLLDQTLCATVGGRWDPASRTAVISIYDNSQWGFEGTNSTWQGFYWTASGAMLMNLATWAHAEYHAVFNEDISHGQIIPFVKILFIQIAIPTWVVSFTMDWGGDDTWIRKSSLFVFFTSVSGDYTLRQVFKQDGSKGYWYDKGFLTYKEGVPVASPYQNFPPLAIPPPPQPTPPSPTAEPLGGHKGDRSQGHY